MGRLVAAATGLAAILIAALAIYWTSSFSFRVTAGPKVADQSATASKSSQRPRNSVGWNDDPNGFQKRYADLRKAGYRPIFVSAFESASVARAAQRR